MLFQDRQGRGVSIDSARKRRQCELSAHEVRIFRARLLEVCLRIMTLEQAGEVVGLAERSVSAELTWLRGERAADRDSLPWDAPELEQPMGPEAEDTDERLST